MKRSTLFISLGLAGVVVVTVGAISHSRLQDPGPSETIVSLAAQPEPRIAAVEWSHELPPVRVAGRLQHEDEADLSFLTGGVVADVMVNSGDQVVAGQVLARLVTTDLQATVDQSRAALEAAERDLVRSRRLVAEKAIPVSVRDNDQTRRDQAAAAVDVALFALERAEIMAPSDGIILQRFHEPDEIVQAGQPVLSFGSVETGWILRAGIPDRDVVFLAKGDRAEIRLDAMPQATLVGSVSEIGRRSDPGTGLFTVELKVTAPLDQIRSGFIASALIWPRAESPVARIPVESIRRSDGRRIQAVAFDPESDRFEEIEFSFRRMSAEILISDDLPGRIHWVVVQGQHSIKFDERS